MASVPHFLNSKTCATYLHGEQLIPILLGELLLAIAVLAFLAWGLVRYFKPKIGRKAYSLAPIPFVLAGVVLLGEFELEKPSQGPPKVVAATKLSNLIRGLPKEAHFSLSGLSFFDGKLYVGTNLGIVEVSDGKPTQLYQFQSRDSVVSGPWLDTADRLLWAMDDHTSELLRFDGNGWTRMQEPVPAKGYYTRGDALEGVEPIGNAEGFWLAAGGTVWKWDSSASTWQQTTVSFMQPRDWHKASDIIGVLPTGLTALLIVRHQPLAFLVDKGTDFLSDELVNPVEPMASPIVQVGKPFLADTWAASEDAGYVCTKEQNMIRVTMERVSPLDAPGACEAVGSDDDLNLLVSIRTKGVFRYAQGKWTLIAGSPYPSGAGDYWTHLAASRGQLAVAIDAKPVVDRQHSSGTDMRFVRNAPTSLWVIKDGDFAPVAF